MSTSDIQFLRERSSLYLQWPQRENASLNQTLLSVHLSPEPSHDSVTELQMLCCKIMGNRGQERQEPRKQFFKICSTEEMIKNSPFTALDVLEWTIELRENIMTTDLQNLKRREKKIQESVDNEAIQARSREQEIERKEQEVEEKRRKLEEERKQMEERAKRQKEREERDEVYNLRQQEILDRQKSLKEKEIELNEKGAILQIVLKLNEKNERFSVQMNRLQSATSEAELNILRQQEIEEREQQVALRQTSLEARELQLEEKNTILEIAIRLNQYRYIVLQVVP